MRSFYLIFLTFAKIMASEFDLAICAVFQNEATFLKEWIEYHKIIGVQHFYLFNNESIDNYAQILKPYVENGEVELFDWPVQANTQKEYLEQVQMPVYQRTLELAQKRVHWLAFIDLDEFLVPIKSKDLPSLLREFEEAGGLCANWQIFGTSGVRSLRERDLITEHLIWKGHENSDIHHQVKWIVQPERVQAIKNPHAFSFKSPFLGMDTQKRPFLEHQMESDTICIDDLQINHYWFGPTDHFFSTKIPRREKWGLSFTLEQIEFLINIFNQTKDEMIFKFIPSLKDKMVQ